MMNGSKKSTAQAMDPVTATVTASPPLQDLNPPALPRGTPLGRYLVLESAGAGGMGTVYAAYDPQLDRKVALKLLHVRAGISPRKEEQRLLREARALARLQHPNVLTVYEVAPLGEGRLVLATEYVQGSTLEGWLQAEDRPLKEVLEVFRAAGRGLAAAHRAGLVHRDFKTANVMVGEEGRVLVLDFGLACWSGADLTGEGEILPLDELEAASHAPGATLAKDANLTFRDGRVGTPRFMAPEQREGGDVDARADQYSFCVALHHGLHGFFPGQPREADGDERPVPIRLQKILQRGLSSAPEQRYPSMDSLLQDLERDPSQTRRLALGALLLLLALVFAISRELAPRPGLCAGAEAQFSQLWNEEEQKALATMFENSNKPWAEDVWKATHNALQRYRDAWVEMHFETCRATRVRGEQSEQLLDLRMECLRQRRREFESFTALLKEGAPEVLERSARAANALPSLLSCADASALLAPLPQPQDDSLKDSIQNLRNRLALALATQETGRYDRGLDITRAVVEEAEELGYWPLIAEALLRQGVLQEEKGDAEQAAGSLEEALSAATAGGHDHVAVEAFVHLVRVSGYQQQNFALGNRWASQAKALLPRLGEPDELAATLADHLGVVLFHQGEFEGALEEHRHALALRQKALGPQHPDVALTQNRIGNVLSQLGDLQGASEIMEDALAINREAYGTAHPYYATNLDLLGLVASELGDSEEARNLHQQALNIRLQAFGPQHPKVATSALHLGGVYSTLGQREEALALFQQALKISQETRGIEHPKSAAALSNIGHELLELGRGQEALEHYTQALEIQRKVYNPEHPWVALTLCNLGVVLNVLGQYEKASEHHQQALAIWRQSYGESHPYLADALTGWGRALRGLGRPNEALSVLEQALEIHRQVEQDPFHQARTRFEFARNLDLLGREPERARELALLARDTFADVGHTRHLESVERWLAARELDSPRR